MLLAAATPICGQTAEEHTDRAAEFVSQGNLRGAEVELRKAVELAPGDPALLTSLGGVLAREGDLQGANKYLKRAVEIDGNDPMARRNLAANQWQLGELPDAAANLELLLKANPGDARAALLMGMIAERRHDYQRSIALLAPLPRIPAEAERALASAYYHAGQPAKALEAAAAGVREAPDSADLVMAKAALESALHYYTDAAVTWKHAVQLMPGAAEARRGLAIAEWRAGMKSEAAADFERGMKDFPQDAEIREQYGTLLLEDGSARGTELLRSAVALDGSLAAARYQLGNAELAAGRLAEARHELETAAKLDPKAARVHFALSRLYRRLGRASDAERETLLWRQLKGGEEAGAGDRPALGIVQP